MSEHTGRRRAACVERIGIVGFAIGATALHVVAQTASPCTPGWRSVAGGAAGVSGPIRAVVSHDDGSGPALYVGGNFNNAGGEAVAEIARWDGSEWSAVGVGLGFHGSVESLAVYDDGSGPALYAGGYVIDLGAASTTGVVRWNGSSWIDVSGQFYGMGPALALLAFDDGSGPRLFAGGEFEFPWPANTARHVAAYDGFQWVGVGGGFDDRVDQLVAYDDGSGAKLYACGSFLTADGQPAQGVAVWNGAQWSSVGGSANGPIWNMATHDDGSGPKLYVSGQFTSIGGTLAQNFAVWNGATWTALSASNPASHLRGMVSFDDGGGADLYATGDFPNAGGATPHNFARWNGAGWQGLGALNLGFPMSASATLAYPHDDGSGSALIVAGYFSQVEGELSANSIARWNPSGWSALGADRALNSAVLAMVAHDDGNGDELIVAGSFTAGGSVTLNHIGAWDGADWRALGSGMDQAVLAVESAAVGGTPTLFAAGPFMNAGGVAASRVARWNGAQWAPLSTGTNATAYALKAFDDGSGLALYVGGDFMGAGGVVVTRVGRWNGTNWSAVGAGLPGSVRAFEVFDDGGGAKLYAAGRMSIIWRWNGVQWTAVTGFPGSSTASNVYALKGFDDGSGPALYWGGSFSYSGQAVSVGRWGGSGGPLLLPPGFFQGFVYSLEVFDDGTGPALFVGGHNLFNNIPPPLRHVMRWDGAWSIVGGDTNAIPSAMAEYDDGSGPALFVGGGFTAVNDTGDSFLGKYAGCSDCPAPKSYCTAGVSANGCAPQISASGVASVSASSGFVVTCNGLDGQRTGLIFYGVAGANAAVWAPGSSSFLCVKTPVQRTTVATTGGSAGACNGQLSLDALAWWATNPGALGQPLQAGDPVWAQGWFRDPQSPGATSLSNSLFWEMCP